VSPTVLKTSAVLAKRSGRAELGLRTAHVPSYAQRSEDSALATDAYYHFQLAARQASPYHDWDGLPKEVG